MRRVLSAAGLLLVLLPAPAREVTAGERTVVVRIRFSRFDPSSLRVRAGTTVRFVVHNADPIGHELILGGRDVQLRHELGTERHHGERDGEVSVAGGGEARTSYTFARPGRVLMGCHLPGHYAYGMRGTVTVTR